jgi:hypothetical protein
MGKNERDLDKTIVELKPKQRSCHAGFFGYSLGDDGLDDLLSSWAGMVIKLWEQVTPIFLASEAKGSKGKKRKDQEKTRKPRHYCCIFFVKRP